MVRPPGETEPNGRPKRFWPHFNNSFTTAAAGIMATLIVGFVGSSWYSAYSIGKEVASFNYTIAQFGRALEDERKDRGRDMSEERRVREDAEARVQQAVNNAEAARLASEKLIQSD